MKEKFPNKSTVQSVIPVAEDGSPSKNLTVLQTGDVIAPVCPMDSDFRQGPGTVGYRIGTVAEVQNASLPELGYRYLREEIELRVLMEGKSG